MKACLTISIILTLWTGCAHAQSYSITSGKISSGGGTSSGGSYSVTGAIGQPEAHAASTGGSYSLSGGFFSQYIALQQAGAPRLAIRKVGGNVDVVWGSNVPGWVLQVNASDLSSGGWADVVGSPTVSGSEPYHQFPAGSGRIFYRLRKR